MPKIKLSNGETVSVKPKSYLKVSLNDGSFAFIPKIVNHIEEKAFNQISIKQFEGIYDDIDYYPEKPGCIMIDATPLIVLDHVENADEDLVNETDMDYSPVPGEDVNHVTLLYGLLENGNKWKKKVDSLLKGKTPKEKWSMSEVKINKVDYFDIGDSYAIIGKLEITPELKEAHGRLLMLPNAQTFSEYLPHITFAYIKKNADVKKWVNSLSEVYNGEIIKTTSINYGDLEDEKKNTKTNRSNSTYSNSKSDEKVKRTKKEQDIINFHSHDEEIELREDLVKANNALSDETNNLVIQQQSSLQNSIQNVENSMVTSMLSKISKTKNKFDDQNEVMSDTEKSKFISELKLIFSAYYLSLFPIYGNQLIRKRATEFSVQVPFDMNKKIHEYIKITARRASQSHVNTIVEDILNTTKKAYEESLRDLEDRLRTSGNYTDAEIYKLAREKALESASQQNIISAIKKKYQDISQTRAKTIARTETNRAFTQSQFQADIQFLNSSGLMNRAYKKWETRSDKPCAYCIDLSERGPIPFESNFQDLGTELSSVFYKKDGSSVIRKLQINYEELSAGNAHVNCACRYVLVIKSEDGDFLNRFNLDVTDNSGNPNHDKLGRFSTGSGTETYKTFTSTETARKYINDNYDTDQIIEPEDIRAIASYTATGHQEMNDYLRNGNLPRKNPKIDDLLYGELGRKPPIDNRAEIIVENVNRLKTMQQSVELKENINLYRAPNMSQEFKVGDTFIDKGFSSTALTEKIATNFNINFQQDSFKQVLKIKAKKGTKGIFPNIFDKGLLENEFILTPGTKYKVTKVTKKKNYKVVEVTI